MDLRKKRSDDGGGTRRGELQGTLAELRDQEALLNQQLVLLKARMEITKNSAHALKLEAPISAYPCPTAEPRDYETKLLQVQGEQHLREVNIWKEVRSCLKAALANKPIASWFGQPAVNGASEASFVAAYTNVIKQPMDLGTISSRLSSDAHGSHYDSPLDVSKDVRLVIANCETYSPDPTVPVRKAGQTLGNMWNKKATGPAGFETRWKTHLNQKAAEKSELDELKRAAHGTLADKILYFDQRVQKRLDVLETPDPTAGSEITYEQRRKLSVSISNLQMDVMYGLMEVIAASMPGSMPITLDGSEEIKLNMDMLSDPILIKMQLYIDHVESITGSQKKRSKDATPAPSNTPSSNNGTTTTPPQNDTVKSEPKSSAPARRTSTPTHGDHKPATNPDSVEAADPESSHHSGGDGKEGKDASTTSNSSSSSDSDSGNSSKGGNSDDEAGSKEKVDSTVPGNDKKWASMPGEDLSAIVSTTRGAQVHPQIIKPADVKNPIEVDDASAWALLPDQINPADECNGTDGSTPADNPQWKEFARKARMKEERDQKVREEDARMKEEQAEQLKKRRLDLQDSASRKTQKLDGMTPPTDEAERAEREAKRKRELLAVDDDDEDDEEEDDEDGSFDEDGAVSGDGRAEKVAKVDGEFHADRGESDVHKDGDDPADVAVGADDAATTGALLGSGLYY